MSHDDNAIPAATKFQIKERTNDKTFIIPDKMKKITEKILHSNHAINIMMR